MKDFLGFLKNRKDKKAKPKTAAVPKTAPAEPDHTSDQNSEAEADVAEAGEPAETIEETVNETEPAAAEETGTEPAADEESEAEPAAEQELLQEQESEAGQEPVTEAGPEESETPEEPETPEEAPEETADAAETPVGEEETKEAEPSESAAEATADKAADVKGKAKPGKKEKAAKQKKEKFPKPKKEKKIMTSGSKNGKLKLILIILLAVVIAAAGGFFAATKFFLKGDAPDKEKKESTKTEESTKESTSKHGEESAKKTSEAGLQVKKITVKAADINIGDLEGHLASEYIKILRTKNYVIKYRTTTVYEGQSFPVETTYAVYGDNIAMASADRSTVILNQNVYMIDHTNRTMLYWRATKTENLRDIDTSDMVFVQSTESGGLVCEEYSTATALIKFCFKDNALVQIATIINKQDVLMDIIEFKEGAPMDLFVVPGDYQSSNITDSTEGKRP